MIHRIFRSFQNSCNGLRIAWQDDLSFRHSLVQVVLGSVLATWLADHYGLGILAWLMLVASLFPILITETVNTAIEAVTDKASPEKHPLARKAKDIGSAAVLLARILALLVWVTVFYARPHG